MAEHTSPGEHPRTFREGDHDLWITANYHLQEWGAPSTPDHDLHGTYQCANGRTITVSHVAAGDTGPEFELAWDVNGDEHGGKVTVIDDATAVQYLVAEGAITVEP